MVGGKALSSFEKISLRAPFLFTTRQLFFPKNLLSKSSIHTLVEYPLKGVTKGEYDGTKRLPSDVESFGVES